MSTDDPWEAGLTALVQEHHRYQRLLGELVRSNAPREDWVPLYRNLADTAADLAQRLERESENYRGRAERWQAGLDRLYRDT